MDVISILFAQEASKDLWRNYLKGNTIQNEHVGPI